MVRPVKVVKFSKLSFRDFPASCTYIFNQKDFEKELLTVSNDGTPYINSLHPDWKAGKEIIASNYIQEEKNYSNKANIMANKLSNFLSKSYDKIMRFIFKQIESTMSN